MLLPLLASAAACGGSVASVGGGDPSSSSSSSSSSSGGGSSSSSTSSSSSSGGSTSSSGGSSSGNVPFTIDLCDASGAYQRLDGIAPGSVVEYMELRDEYQSTGWTPQPVVVAQSGTACATASDQPACQDALANAHSAGWNVESTGMEMPRERYLVTTSGDSLEFQSSIADLTSFLGPIDTAKDAALIVTATDKYRIVCGEGPQARKTTTGWEIAAQTGSTCGANTKLEQHILSVTTNGNVSVVSTKLIQQGDPNCAIGRRPVGLADKPDSTATGSLARFFADAAYLEAASVFAFERLERELVALGAPSDLAVAARASRDDEVRHARMTASLARRFGANSAEPRVAATAPRSAFEIALENAVEGCVRETYGALVAHYQARTSEDRAIACIMQVIADDETRHASLAWDVAAWLEPRLSRDERRRIDEARAEAIAELRVELEKPIDEELARVAGMPRAPEALALLDALDANHLRAAA